MGISRKYPKCTVVCCVFLVYCLLTSGRIDATLRHYQNHHRHSSHHLSSSPLSSSSSPQSSSSSLFTSLPSDSLSTSTSSSSSYSSTTSSSSSSSSLEFKTSADQIFARDSEVEDDSSSSHSKDNFQLSRSQNDFYKRFMGATSNAKDHPSQQTTPQKDALTPPRARMPYGLNKELLEIRKANEHYLKVYTNARCKIPKARVIRVKEYYPDASKEYLPSCTIIHKCGDDTGCCDSENMQCVAKKQDIVELHFYKLHLHHGGGGIGISGSDTVEKLAFLNDTECECQDLDNRPRFSPRKRACLQCPSGFTLRESQPGVCHCDCFDKQKSCLKMKRGRERLSDFDRRCVDARKCHQPECEYGQYDPTIGRCPRKHERQNSNLSDNHWWRVDERD